jgi:hypothetical protein
VQVNVTEPVRGYNNEPIRTNGESGPVTIWREILVGALNNFAPNENLSGEDKLRCFRISLKLTEQEVVDLSVDECSFILGRVKQLYGPLIIGRADQLFNQTGAASRSLPATNGNANGVPEGAVGVPT